VLVRRRAGVWAGVFVERKFHLDLGGGRRIFYSDSAERLIDSYFPNPPDKNPVYALAGAAGAIIPAAIAAAALILI
jgi:hypothetical protein